MDGSATMAAALQVQQQERRELHANIAEKDLRPKFPEEAAPTLIRSLARDCWGRNSARRPAMKEVVELLRTALEVRVMRV